MFVQEALWIRAVLGEFAPQRGTVLDLGSSTEEFRRLQQPHIDFYVFRPLRRRGLRVIHVDAKHGDGVDVMLDLAAPWSADGPLAPAPVVIATNLLEHVADRQLIARRIAELTLPGGLAIVTAPHVYPYHPDPIDTLFRPTPAELVALWPCEFDVVRAETLVITPPLDQGSRSLVARVARRIARHVHHVFGKPAFAQAVVALRRRDHSDAGG